MKYIKVQIASKYSITFLFYFFERQRGKDGRKKTEKGQREKNFHILACSQMPATDGQNCGTVSWTPSWSPWQVASTQFFEHYPCLPESALTGSKNQLSGLGIELKSSYVGCKCLNQQTKCLPLMYSSSYFYSLPTVLSNRSHPYISTHSHIHSLFYLLELIRNLLMDF